MDKNYERSKEILESSKRAYATKEEKIQDLNKKMTGYKKENEWMKQDDGLKEKYNHEIEAMKAHINREKQIIKGDIESVIIYAQKINESILPYIKGTDANAEMRMKVNAMRCEKIETELEKLETERDAIPKDIQEYTQEGRERVQKINDKIETLESEKSKLTNDNEMYAKRKELLSQYKQNTETIATYKKNAKQLGITLETTPTPTPTTPTPTPTTPTTPTSTPTTPTSTPTTPTSTPTTPTSTPTTPTSTPTTPTSTPTTPTSIPTTPTSTPTTPTSTPTTPTSTPTTPTSTPTTPTSTPTTPGEEIQSITINANTGKATVISKQGEKEFEIEECIENKKSIYERANLDEILENKGKKSALAKALFKRKVNPVILKAIESNGKMLEGYIDSLMDNKKELPFKYVHNLEKSSLSNKNARFMNRIGVKEEKIKDAVVKGTEKFFGIKNFFRNMKKNKILGASQQPKQLSSGQQKPNNLRNDPNIVVNLEKLENERKARAQEIYNGLSKEQKAELSKLSVQSINTTELQKRYGISYTEVHNLVELYGKKTSQNQPAQSQPAQNKAQSQNSGQTLTL